MAVTGATVRAALAAVGAVGGQLRSFDELATGADGALRQAPAGLTAAGAASFLATMAQESAYLRTTTEYGSKLSYDPFRGRTFEQITFEGNYRDFGRWCQARDIVSDAETFVRNPASLSDYRYAWLGGVWYFASKGLWAYANRGDHYSVSQGVNRGVGAIGGPKAPLHWKERKAMYGAFLRAGNSLLPAGGPVAAAPAPARPKVEPVIQNFPVVGAGALELNVPIKGSSGLYRAAYISVRSTAGGGKVDIWWGQSGVGGRGEAHWTLEANARRYTELTGGSDAPGKGIDQATIHYDMGRAANGQPAIGAITVEFAPK